MKKDIIYPCLFQISEAAEGAHQAWGGAQKSYESRHLHALKRVRGKRGTEKKETKSKFLGPSIVSGQIFLGDNMGGGS